MYQITLYSTPTCSYCRMTKMFFMEHKIDYHEIDVAADEEAAERMIQKTGQMGVPVIVIEKDRKEEIIIGFQPERIRKILGIR